MTERDFHPDVKRLLDGELRIEDLTPELRAEAQEALRLIAAVDRGAPTLSSGFEDRVMARIRRRPAALLRRWMLVPALAAAAVLVLVIARLTPSTPPYRAEAIVTVRFELVAPAARQVSVAGTFNGWNPAATPLVRSAETGVWSATLSVPAGEHQYAFLVDGERWVADPQAPAVDDGFGGGRRNSVLTL